MATKLLLSLSGLEKHRSEFILCFDGLLKQSRPGSEYSRLHLKAYPPDRRLLCLYGTLGVPKAYKSAQAEHRKIVHQLC